MKSFSAKFLQVSLSRTAHFAVLVSGAMALLPAAHATPTGMGVSAGIVMACSIGSATSNMDFSALSLIDTNGGRTSADFAGVGAFPVICTNGTTGVTLSFSDLESSGFAVSKGSDKISYTLYSDSGHTAGLSNGVAANAFSAFGFNANGVSQSLSVYGKIANADAQGKPIGDYTDNVTITVQFDAT